MLVQEPIQAAIWHCLNHYAYIDATFLAERLLAEVNSEEALHLLATSYYRSGKVGQAYTLLRMHGYNSPQLKYLMAKCCYELGKLDEAECTLTGGSVLRPKQIEDIVTEYGSIACFALQLLGLICAKTERTAKSMDSLRKCLSLNPFLWHSFATLCDNGDKPDPNKIFKLEAVENFTNIHGNTLNSLINHTENHSNNTHPESVITSNTLSNVSMNTPTCNENVLQIHSQQQTTPITNHINTPNNTLSNIPLITMTPVQQNINSIVSTPIHYPLNTPVNVPESFDSFESIPKVKKFVRFQWMFGNPTSNLSPINPSFGVLPLEAQHNDSDSSVFSSSIAMLTPSPLGISLIDSQSNNKIHSMNIGKRILCRNVSKDSPLVINKPAVFAPAGNNSNYQSPPSGQAYVRRSSRLFSNSSSVKENNKNRFVAPKSPAARKTKTRSSKNQNSLSELNEKNKIEHHEITEKKPSEKSGTAINLSQQALSIQKQSAEGLMALLRDMGAAYLQLAQFECDKAIELFFTLPSHHYNTGWVLSHLAKAYFEKNGYNEAVKYFSEVREKEPCSLHLMEYYSTALWHLQKEVQISALAQDIVEVDGDSPQAWCATGNCFSLQKEHEAAIKFFSRAIQVDPNFAYAYTLLGHEHLVTEELDRALSCYRSAVRIDPRHYNAWYGIGLVLFKQERFAQAEWYFKKALSIHPNCSVLLCHVAVVEHTLQKSNMALMTLKKALAIDSRNPLCKYHKASILHDLDYNQEALKELLQLKEIVPKESNVYFLLGKVYKRLGDTHLALMNFSWAMDLDPKGANTQFKEAVDPAINCFPPDEDDSTNNNPQQNVSEASSSLMAAESSRESLILDAPNIDIEEQPTSSSSLSTLVLGPNFSSSSTAGSDSSTTAIASAPSSSGLNSSSTSFRLMTPPSISTSRIPSSTPPENLDLISWIGSRSFTRKHRANPRISGSASTSGAGSSGIHVVMTSPLLISTTASTSSTSSINNIQVPYPTEIGGRTRFSNDPTRLTSTSHVITNDPFDNNSSLSLEEQISSLLQDGTESPTQSGGGDINGEIL